MECIYPQTKEKVVNGSHFTYQHPCGQCMPCRITRRQQWTLKILLESKLHDHSTFVTLTYAPEHYPDDTQLDKPECQRFIKRLRNNLKRDFDETMRYFLVGEYGEKTYRAHYHAVIFGPSIEVLESCMTKSWKKGFFTLSELNPTRAQYVARYTTKKLIAPERSVDGFAQEFALMSRKPALGHGILPNVAASLKRLRSSTKCGPSVVEWEKQTASTLPACLRVDGRILPMDSCMKEKLGKLLNCREPSDLEKALTHTVTQRWPDYAMPQIRAKRRRQSEEWMKKEMQKKGQI